ncbi:ATP-binding protein [Nitrosomonas communis]|uniref:Adenylate kinase n=1 Tax=Nitrosomonas communis TaxID=44574 RepID=A0A1I4S2N6_9PROT|nr:ATP-binding protein [Nitrosomonas communis]SFM58786.1 adenylate kinase [Nitrosomonas communis]
MNIGLFGISGVGKSYMTSAITAENNSLIAVKASDILRAYNKKTQFDGLSSNIVSENQQSLIEGFAYFREKNCGRNIILELHNIIETPDGEVEIDDNVFDFLELDAVCFLYIDPERLLQQRSKDSSRIRQEISLENLRGLQERSLTKFLNKYKCQGIPYKILKSSDISGFLRYMKSLGVLFSVD